MIFFKCCLRFLISFLRFWICNCPTAQGQLPNTRAGLRKESWILFHTEFSSLAYMEVLSTLEGVVICFSSGSLLVSVKNTIIPTTLFSFPSLLDRSNFWWKGKEQRKVIGQGWSKSITSRANPLNSLLPEATIWGVWDKQSHCKTNCCETEGCCQKELHPIHPTAP